MAHDVFISYSHHDKAAADAVCAMLEEHQLRCWIAPRDVIPGADWASSIIHAINDTRVMVLVFSSKANESLQIQKEVERAVHKSVVIIPLRIEDVVPTESLEYFVSNVHWLDALTPPLETHLKNLADIVNVVLKRIPSRNAAQVTTPMPAAAAPPKLEIAKAGVKPVAKTARFRWTAVTVATLLVIGLATGGWLFYSRKSHSLTDKDTIVLGDFTNTTEDPVFDGALRQGLSVQLEQSPFLSLVSDQGIQQTLRMMGQKADVRLTPEIARELCQRTGSKASIDGSIAQIGTQYLLTLKAVNCASGEILASTEAQSSDKSHVLDALGKTAAEIRNKLGESLSTVQKFDTPLVEATTSSLEALQDFSLGFKAQLKFDYADAVALYQRAIALDPNFASAYRTLSATYGNLGENSLAAESARRAYELRERTSVREKLSIEARYYTAVTGDREKARQTYELFTKLYPRGFGAHNNLAVIYLQLGQYDNALAEIREALHMQENGLTYVNLADSYVSLNQLEEARATVKEAQKKNFDSPNLHIILYQLAFLQNDATGMAEQVAWAAGTPGPRGDLMLAQEAGTAAYSGRLREAREFSGQVMASAEHAQQKETAAGYQAGAAVREALFGNAAEALQRASAALALSTDRYAQCSAAEAMAFAGDATRAQALADDLAKRFPEDTAIQLSCLPIIRTQIALSRNNPSKATELLLAAAPTEMGSSSGLYPAYVRGNAYLALHQGSEAAAESQKILDHRGIVRNDPIGALADLQIARAYILQGDTAKARAAYQDFLTLWKDADPDIPILIAAKAEYARLK